MSSSNSLGGACAPLGDLGALPSAELSARLGQTASGDSGGRAAKRCGRSCRPAWRSSSRPRSISNGRSTASSRCPLSWRGCSIRCASGSSAATAAPSCCGSSLTLVGARAARARDRAAGADARVARTAHAGAARSRVEPAAGADRSGGGRRSTSPKDACCSSGCLRARCRPTRLRRFSRGWARSWAATASAHRARRHISSRRIRDGDIRSAAHLY